MYFPYLRSKQYELIALKEIIPWLKPDQHVIPIIEPVKENLNALFKMLEEYKKNSLSYIFIVNPQVGGLMDNPVTIEKIKKDFLSTCKNCSLGYHITAKTNLSDVKTFLGSNKPFKISLLHTNSFNDLDSLVNLISEYKGNIQFNILKEENTSRIYRKTIRSSFDSVILSDSVKKCKNADYPIDEYFSDLSAIYKDEQYVGFGDFLTIGDEYYETGGPAYAIAIHLTYKTKSEEIRIRRFISDSNDTPVDPAGKFLEALKKFHAFMTSSLNSEEKASFSSSACKELMQFFKDEHYPGLGYLKKLSIKHHIELMLQIIKGK